MVTSMPFGFISYNSQAFLRSTLERFISESIFVRCACWFHESLDSNSKNHYHCWVEPARQIDTSVLPSRFDEVFDSGVRASIAIRPRCKSDWNNAYLYGIHDSDYLAFKGLQKEQVNIKSDFHIYLGDFTADIAQANSYRLHKCLAPYQRLKELVQGGKSLEEVYTILRTPFAQFYTVKQAYYSILRDMHISAPKTLIEMSDSDFRLLIEGKREKNRMYDYNRYETKMIKKE